MAVRGLTGFGLLVVSMAVASCTPPPPEAPSAPEFDPKIVFRDLSRGSSRPMVVDWSPDDRAELEARTGRGAILVRVTENGIEPLWDCAIPDGSRYEFTGVSPKRDRVDARSDAELAANFPMGFAKLRSLVKSGQSITADVRMVGVAELNRLSVKGADLSPQCRKATHFVKELTIGGFQFGSAALRQAGAGAGAAGFGADVGYTGLANRLTEEGDFRVCEAADPDSRSAPPRCKGILRIRLVPIDQDATQVQTTCGAGMRWDGRACVVVATPASTSTQAPPATAYECTKGNLAECMAQCKNGNAASCTYAGQAAQQSQQASLDDLKALYGAACKGSHWEGCSSLADVYTFEHQDTQAANLYGLACVNGFSAACTNYGVAVYFGRGGTKEDRGLAFKLWERACRLGDFAACSNAGVVVNKGEGGLTRDPASARRLFEVACKNNDAGGCSNYAFMLENGLSGPKDKNEAFKLYLGACEKGNPAGCINGGLLLEESFPNDLSYVQKALALYEKACDMPSAGDGCASFAENKAIHGNLYTDAQLDRRSCDGSTQAELGCFNAAVVYASDRYGLKNQAKMVDFARRACKTAGVKKDLCKNFR